MQTINKFSLKHISLLAVIAILFMVTVESKDRSHFFTPLPTSSLQDSPPGILSKKGHFSVAKKQNLISDTLPGKNLSAFDTLAPKKTDSLFLNDSVSIQENDTDTIKKTTDTIHFKSAQNALEAPITYTAEDSMVLDVDSKTVTLYGKKANTNFKDNELTAPVISFDQASGDIIASIKRDSAGKVISLPTYKQSDFTSQSDSIRFNMKSGKGLTKSTYTQQ
ncbi:MAG: hypothetical protein ABIR03_12495 [Ginsengibacter sp.]